jgi:hypothetical protein
MLYLVIDTHLYVPIVIARINIYRGMPGRSFVMLDADTALLYSLYRNYK